jgi:hypothetical protein
MQGDVQKVIYSDLLFDRGTRMIRPHTLRPRTVLTRTIRLRTLFPDIFTSPYVSSLKESQSTELYQIMD